MGDPGLAIKEQCGVDGISLDAGSQISSATKANKVRFPGGCMSDWNGSSVVASWWTQLTYCNAVCHPLSYYTTLLYGFWVPAPEQVLWSSWGVARCTLDHCWAMQKLALHKRWALHSSLCLSLVSRPKNCTQKKFHQQTQWLKKLIHKGSFFFFGGRLCLR